MRILIIGAGIGGLMLTALLERRGVRPIIVECAPSFEHAGYMLGPCTLGSCVLCGLGLYQRFVEVGVEVTCYEMHDVRLVEPTALLRNVAVRFYSLQMFARNIAKAFDAPIRTWILASVADWVRNDDSPIACGFWTRARPHFQCALCRGADR